MAKKLFVLGPTALLFFILSCAPKKPRGASLDIIGSFKAVKLGRALSKLGISLPVCFTFYDNMRFKLKLVSFGKDVSYSGVYEIDSSSRPAVIRIKRNDGKSFHGIIVFTSRDKFKMLIYNETLFPIPSSFNLDEEQVFARVS